MAKKVSIILCALIVSFGDTSVMAMSCDLEVTKDSAQIKASVALKSEIIDLREAALQVSQKMTALIGRLQAGEPIATYIVGGWTGSLLNRSFEITKKEFDLLTETSPKLKALLGEPHFYSAISKEGYVALTALSTDPLSYKGSYEQEFNAGILEVKTAAQRIQDSYVQSLVSSHSSLQIRFMLDQQRLILKDLKANLQNKLVNNVKLRRTLAAATLLISAAALYISSRHFGDTSSDTLLLLVPLPGTVTLLLGVTALDAMDRSRLDNNRQERRIQSDIEILEQALIQLESKLN